MEEGHVSQRSSGEVSEIKQSASANLPNSEGISPPEKRRFDEELLLEAPSLSKRMEDIAFQQLLEEITRSVVFSKVMD